ncbi:ParB/RepB/Spo0J family partition protein [Sulfitobacter sp. PM12]|uniref:ParB/RepB/Spo0J family partition protein n=1 Tax=Sulfitobacter sp. PM12 TaxID=3138497 RepID=UPI00388E0837
MAKRKRLTPPRGDYLAGEPVTDAGSTPSLETKALFPTYPQGVAPKMRSPSPPIAHVASDAATSAALAEVTAELHSARAEGRMVQSLHLDQIESSYLVRDRLVADDEDMAALRASLSARGQQTPIEVVSTEQGGYGLISGWRRLTALTQLYKETGDAHFSTVLALVRRPVDAADAYVAMVEENEIRVGLSYFERARIVSRAVEEGVYIDTKSALNGLFGNGSRAKRSKIKSFLPVVEQLGPYLSYPAGIGERLGLALSQKLQADEAFKSDVVEALNKLGSVPTLEAEQDILAAALETPKAPKIAKQAGGKREELSPGLWLERSAKTITIGGTELTPEVEKRIRAALNL